MPAPPTPVQQCKAVIQKPVDSACDWYKTVTLTPAEIQLIRDGTITKETAGLILANNQKYDLTCKPKK